MTKPNSIQSIVQIRCIVISSKNIKNSLIESSKKVASEIALKIKERNKLNSDLVQYENQLTLLEVKIEVYREKRDDIQEKLAAKKLEKNDFFTKRDNLIQKKRMFQQELNDSAYVNQSDLNEKISQTSESIGDVIEKSKALSTEMQFLYDESQVEHDKMIAASNDFNQEKYDLDNTRLSFKMKIAEIEKELTNLRRKMFSINESLETSHK